MYVFDIPKEITEDIESQSHGDRVEALNAMFVVWIEAAPSPEEKYALYFVIALIKSLIEDEEVKLTSMQERLSKLMRGEE